MTVWRLISREIRYRKLNFGLGVLAALVAVACLVGELALLRANDVRSERAGEVRVRQARDRGVRLEDDYRRIMTQLGYNVLVLSKDEDLVRFYAQGYATATMPEEYVQRLAASPIITVQHLLPSLQEKIEWPERKFPILLMGTRDEVPIKERDSKKSLLSPAGKGTMIVGTVVAQRLNLKAGDPAELLGRPFTVARVQPARGNEDDVTVWINLAEAQTLLGKPGRINAILALSCFCAEATPEGIRKEVSAALEGKVQVLELSAQAATRRAARARAAAHGEESLAAEQATHDQLRTEREALAAWLVPLVIVVCTVWVGVLAFNNVRERRSEIGILRALGVRSWHVLMLFIVRAKLAGFIGAAVGYAVGLGVAAAWDARTAAGGECVGPAELFAWTQLVAVLVLAPAVAALASLAPAMLAARQDPADVLRQE